MKRTWKIALVLLLVLSMVLPLTGCGEEKKAEAAVAAMCTALKNGDLETAQAYIDVEELTATDEGLFSADEKTFMTAVFGTVECTIIGSTKQDSDTVLVTAEITNLDMKPVVGTFFQKALQYAFSIAFAEPQPTDEEMNAKMVEMFTESIAEADTEPVNNVVTICVVRQEDGWKIETDDVLVDALSGGLMGALNELSQSFAE